MKKLIGILALSFALFACNDSATDENVNADTSINNNAVIDTSSNNSIEGNDLSDKAQNSSVDTANDIGVSADSTY